MLWSETSCSWFFSFYFILFGSFLIFLHLSGDCCIEFFCFNSSITFLLAHLIFVKLNFFIIVYNVRCLDIIPLFQFLFESWKCVSESSFFPRMWFLEHFVILIGFHVIRIVQLFQRSEFLIDDWTNKTCVFISFWENWFCFLCFWFDWGLLKI